MLLSAAKTEVLILSNAELYTQFPRIEWIFHSSTPKKDQIILCVAQCKIVVENGILA